MSLRYGKQTFALELGMIFVALLFLFPVYVLVTLVVQEHHRRSAPAGSACRRRWRPRTTRRHGAARTSVPR